MRKPHVISLTYLLSVVIPAHQKDTNFGFDGASTDKSDFHKFLDELNVNRFYSRGICLYFKCVNDLYSLKCTLLIKWESWGCH